MPTCPAISKSKATCSQAWKSWSRCRIPRGPGVRIDADTKKALARAVLRLGIIGPPPKPPSEEAKIVRGHRHDKRRDAVAVSHHYDVGNDFYRLVLGEFMTYSCGYWTTADDGLTVAQYAKCDLLGPQARPEGRYAGTRRFMRNFRVSRDTCRVPPNTTVTRSHRRRSLKSLGSTTRRSPTWSGCSARMPEVALRPLLRQEPALGSYPRVLDTLNPEMFLGEAR